MGKKQSAGVTKQKPGTDITRFLERRVPSKAVEVGKDGRGAADVQSSGGRASTPGKHLLDNVLLSQDGDDGGMHVVWASSPTATFSPQKGGGSSQEVGGMSQQQADNSQASKDGFRKTLIQAVQRAPSEAELLMCGQLQQPADDMLEQLLAGRISHRAASTAAPTAERQQRLDGQLAQEEVIFGQPNALNPSGVAAEGSGAHGIPSREDLIMQEVLASTDTYKTPAAGRHPRPPAVAYSTDVLRQTPSALTIGAKRPLAASGKKAASGGNKRRALLDILDQVELMVKHRGAAATPQPLVPPKRSLPTEPGKLPTSSTEEAQRLDAEMPYDDTAAVITGAEEHSLLARDSAPRVSTASAQLALPLFIRREPVLKSNLGIEAHTVEHSIVSAELTPGNLQAPKAAAVCVMPTQSIDEAGHCPDSTTTVNSKTCGTTAFPVEGRILQGLMLPPTARSVPGLPIQEAGGATRMLSPDKVLATPLPGLPSMACESHGHGGPHASGSRQVNLAGGGLADICAKLDTCPKAWSDVPRPPWEHPTLNLPAVADDDEDDAFWGDVDIDALVANATSCQSCISGAHPGEVMAPKDTVGNSLLQRGSVHQAPSVRPGEQRSAQSSQHLARCPPEATTRSPPQRSGFGNLSGQHDSARPAPNPVISAAASLPALDLLGERSEVHFVVLEVEQSSNSYDKVLRCFNEYKGAEVRVCLRDMWSDQEVQPGDTVNVIGGRVLPSPTCTTLEVSGTEGLLVLHPDVLLSGTSVCTAIRCARQAWLQDRVASGPSGEKALIGSMLHELLQRSLRAAIQGKLDKDVMMAEAQSILAVNTDKLLESHQDEASVLAYITQQLDGIISWCNSYVTPNPAAPHGGRIEGGNGDMPTYCRVNEVLDIEESIWAPKYGLKGQLDASLRVKLSGPKEPLRVSEVQQLSRKGPIHFHGLRDRRASEGALAGSSFVGDAVTGVIGAGRVQPHVGRSVGKPQHPWSATKAAPDGVQSVGAHTRKHLTELTSDADDDDVVAPFEFKTGKDWHEHRAQVLLYLLLMEDRYGTAVRTGLLWNSHKPTMQAVRYVHHELASLIMHRNRLAAYLVGAAREPPPPLQGSDADRKCEYCGVRATCALYLAAARASGAAQGDGAQGDKQVSAAAHLVEMDLHQTLREDLLTVAPSSAVFFAHWVGLVDQEEYAVRGNRMDMWALSGPQREEIGGCVAQLLLERELPPKGDIDGQRYVYMFRRRQNADPATGGPGSIEPSLAGNMDADTGAGGLLSAGFACGDSALLGVEGRHAAAARVSVVDVTKDTITVACRKELKYVKLGGVSRPTCGCRDGGGHPSAARGHCDACLRSSEHVTWRLDRDESASLFAQLRLNLALLCVPGAGGCWSGDSGTGGRKGTNYNAVQARREGQLMQLRKLIIDLEAPQQGLGQGTLCASSQLSASAASSQLQANSYLRRNAHKMNGEQLEAVQRVLAMQDYAILLGMPGTGKTSTIVHIIRALVETHATILVASYTNSAVDNILMKLIGNPVSFVRLGSAQAVHPAVQPYMPGGEHHPDTSVAGLQDLMGRVNVVGCTCLSVHNPLLTGRTFSVCILDEASQVTLPASIGALSLARSFLLVGDHYQLSPLVVSREAAQGGLGISLFRRLSEAHPQAVVTLRSQYRMAADIMAVSNALVYNGRMLCGDESVAHSMMCLPYLASLSSYGSVIAQDLPRSPWPCTVAVPSWLMALMRPECRVVFLDTDSVAGCREVALRDGMINRGEVQLVYAIASALIAAGLPPLDIGVASPYKAQVGVLQQALAQLGRSSTVDLLNLRAETRKTVPCGIDSDASVEVLTVDKYQGRDKSAILLSFVRCNASRSAGRLLADWQRLNVAITRARTKLVLLGSAATLASIPMLEDMLLLLKQNGWVQQLPVECLAELPAVPSTTVAVYPTAR